jgi:hypothetical protein
MMKLPDSLQDPLFTFDPRRHLYHYGRQRLTSASAWKKRFKKPFDSDYWAGKKAGDLGMTPEEVKAMWKAKGDVSRELGTEVHLAIERHFQGLPPQAELSLEGWNRFNLFLALREGRMKNVRVVAQELRLYSLKYKIAGTLDFLGEVPGKGLMIGDWKTNGKFKVGASGFDYLKRPFDDLKDNELNEYAIQVALYRIMAEEHGLQIYGGFIAHLGPDMPEARVYFPEDLTSRVRKALGA